MVDFTFAIAVSLASSIQPVATSKLNSPSLDSSSLSGFKNDNDARRFGFVRPQARQGLIAPAGKADNLTSLNFFFRHFGRLQDIEATAIEKERMIPKQVVQFQDGGMVIGKYLRMELAQGLVYLCRV